MASFLYADTGVKPEDTSANADSGSLSLSGLTSGGGVLDSILGGASLSTNTASVTDVGAGGVLAQLQQQSQAQTSSEMDTSTAAMSTDQTASVTQPSLYGGSVLGSLTDPNTAHMAHSNLMTSAANPTAGILGGFPQTAANPAGAGVLQLNGQILGGLAGNPAGLPGAAGGLQTGGVGVGAAMMVPPLVTVDPNLTGVASHLAGTFRSNVLYIGNLQWWITDGDLQKICDQFGTVINCKIHADKVNGKSKGYGYVEFDLNEDMQSITQARDNLNGYVYKECRLVVAFATPDKLKEAEYSNTPVHIPRAKLHHISEVNQFLKNAPIGVLDPEMKQKAEFELNNAMHTQDQITQMIQLMQTTTANHGSGNPSSSFNMNPTGNNNHNINGDFGDPQASAEWLRNLMMNGNMSGGPGTLAGQTGPAIGHTGPPLIDGMVNGGGGAIGGSNTHSGGGRRSSSNGGGGSGHHGKSGGRGSGGNSGSSNHGRGSGNGLTDNAGGGGGSHLVHPSRSGGGSSGGGGRHSDYHRHSNDNRDGGRRNDRSNRRRGRSRSFSPVERRRRNNGRRSGGDRGDRYRSHSRSRSRPRGRGRRDTRISGGIDGTEDRDDERRYGRRRDRH